MILTMEAGCGRKELHEQTMLGDIGETREAGGGAEEEKEEEEEEREEEEAEEGEGIQGGGHTRLFVSSGNWTELITNATH